MTDSIEEQIAREKQRMDKYGQLTIPALIARLEAAEAKLDKVREALENVDAVAIDYGHLESAARTMKDIAARAYEDTAP